MPPALVKEFSSRSRDIDVEADRLIEAYVEKNGHRPGRRTITKIRAQASLATCPEKHVHPLADLTVQWRARATAVLSRNATTWATEMASNVPHPLLRADDVPLEVIAEVCAGRSR